MKYSCAARSRRSPSNKVVIEDAKSDLDLTVKTVVFRDADDIL